MKRILYFVKGLPSEAQKAEAYEMGAVIRNASFVNPGDFIEPCDGVAGPDVPEDYAAKFDCVSVDAPKKQKSLTQMNTAELDTYAAELGIDFPKEATTNKEKAAFIKTHLEANN